MQAPVQAVIFDLDGTILDTESLCIEVSKHVVSTYGKTLTQDVIKVATGKRPLDAWKDVVRILDIKEDPQVLLDQSEPMMAAGWPDARLLPGSMRLLNHLQKSGVAFGVATSTPRATFNIKMSKKPELKALLQNVVCGDEVINGKPEPDLFLAAAKLIGISPQHCVVVEDAVSGVQGATCAGMRVLVVPSQIDHTDYPEADDHGTKGVIQLLPSLMAFQPESLGLPPYTDLVHGVTPMDTPIQIRGTVVKGFGRGSKDLGIPTANVDSASLHASLCEAVTGIYAGYVSIGSSDEVYKTALSIGWNPHFGNKHKTCEPWILHEFDKPFYDEDIRLVVCAYIRPEAKFISLQTLVDRILMDGEVAKKALDDDSLKAYQHHPFLKP